MIENYLLFTTFVLNIFNYLCVYIFTSIQDHLAETENGELVKSTK